MNEGAGKELCIESVGDEDVTDDKLRNKAIVLFKITEPNLDYFYIICSFHNPLTNIGGNIVIKIENTKRVCLEGADIRYGGCHNKAIFTFTRFPVRAG